jgi:hypothetical protein
MSVDQRIREGLSMIDQQLPDADTQTGFDVVVHEAAYRTFRQRALVLAVGAVAAGGLTMSALQAAGGPDGSPAPPPAQVSGRQTEPVSLEGTWRSAPVSAAGLADFLRSIDHGERAGRLRDALPNGPHRLTLRFDRRTATLSMGEQVVDRHRYVVDDDLLQLVNVGDSRRLSTYTFDVQQDRLSLTFFGSTEPPKHGVPAMQYELALYTAVPFHRLAPGQ